MTETPKNLLEGMEWQKEADKILPQLFGPDLLQTVKAGGDVAEKIWQEQNEKIRDIVKANPDLRKQLDDYIKAAPNGDLFKPKFEALIKLVVASDQKDERKNFMAGILGGFGQGLSLPGIPKQPDVAPPTAAPESSGVPAAPVAGEKAAPAAQPGTAPNPQPVQPQGPATLKAGEIPKGGWTQKQLREMSMADIVKNIITVVTKGLETIKTGAKKVVPEVTAKMGLSFSKEEADKMAFNSNAEAEKQFSRADSFKYVAAVLGLDLSKKKITNSLEFLNALKNSPDFTFKDQKAEIKEAKAGDVIFFAKKNDKGEEEIYLSGVISSTEPPKMKTIPENTSAATSAPVEIELEQSEDYKNNFHGFIKIPKNHKETAPSQAVAPAANAPAQSPPNAPDPGAENKPNPST